MFMKAVALAIIIGALTCVPSLAQAQAAPAQQAPAQGQATPAPPAQGQPPARGQGRGGQGVGATGTPDPGVNFLVVVDNAHVRVLQVTLQPGAVRRNHVHNDVTFHMMVPVTGSLELTVEKDPVITAVPGQAYYMMKGQNHGFANKGSAPVQVIELFIKPDPGAAAAAPTATTPTTK
jgi:quercetin dioxygenase-like cupin family protein